MTTPTSVDAWRDHNGEQDYSVSLCGDDGEIRCLDTADTEEEAWRLARQYADKHGVPARTRAGDGMAETRDYQPSAEES